MALGRDQPGDPNVTDSTDVLVAISTQCRIRSITTKAQWRAAIASVVTQANWTAGDPTLLALVRIFFQENWDIGGPG